MFELRSKVRRKKGHHQEKNKKEDPTAQMLGNRFLPQDLQVSQWVS